MASSLDQEPLLAQDIPVPLNITAMIQFLERRNDDFAIRLADVLRQLNGSILKIWNLLKLAPEEIEAIELYSPTGDTSTGIYPSAIFLADETTLSNRIDISPTVINMVNANESFNVLCGGDQILMNLIRNGNLDIYLTTSSAGVSINLAAGGQIKVNGLKVLTDRQATVSAVTGTAGATYGATEQAMINNLKTAVNDLISRLQGMGIIA